MWCFKAKFSDDEEPVELRVNAEDYDQLTATQYAEFYAKATGRIPYLLRRDLDVITIHDGNYAFGGAPGHILIHVGSSVQYEGATYFGHILEEVLVHEGAHAALDKRLYRTDEWNNAVAEDNKFVSGYAK